MYFSPDPEFTAEERSDAVSELLREDLFAAQLWGRALSLEGTGTRLLHLPWGKQGGLVKLAERVLSEFPLEIVEAHVAVLMPANHDEERAAEAIALSRLFIKMLACPPWALREGRRLLAVTPSRMRQIVRIFVSEGVVAETTKAKAAAGHGPRVVAAVPIDVNKLASGECSHAPPFGVSEVLGVAAA